MLRASAGGQEQGALASWRGRRPCEAVAEANRSLPRIGGPGVLLPNCARIRFRVHQQPIIHCACASANLCVRLSRNLSLDMVAHNSVALARGVYMEPVYSMHISIRSKYQCSFT